MVTVSIKCISLVTVSDTVSRLVVESGLVPDLVHLLDSTFDIKLEVKSHFTVPVITFSSDSVYVINVRYL